MNKRIEVICVLLALFGYGFYSLLLLGLSIISSPDLWRLAIEKSAELHWTSGLVKMKSETNAEETKYSSPKGGDHKVEAGDQTVVPHSADLDLVATAHIEDADLVPWLNTLLEYSWRTLLVSLVNTDNANKLLDKIDDHLRDYLTIREASLGVNPPSITGIKVNDSDSKLSLDVGILYPGNCSLKIGLMDTDIAISGSDLGFAGKIRVDMGSLDRDLSFLKGAGVELLGAPPLRGRGFLLLAPLAGALLKLLLGRWTVALMLPRSVMPHVPTLSQPYGVLRVLLVEARNIPITDLVLANYVGLEGGSSDPYCVLTVERHSFASRVIKKSLNPVWNSYAEFPVLEPGLIGTVGNQERVLELKVQLMDYDRGADDEKTGFASIDLSGVSLEGEVTDTWRKTRNSAFQEGEVHLRIQFARVSESLPQPLHQPLHVQGEPCSAGFVVLYVQEMRCDKAEPIIPMISVQVFGKTTRYTTAQGEMSSCWDFEEEIPILIEDPHKDWLRISLHDCSDTSSLSRDLFFRRPAKDNVSLGRALSHKNQDWRYAVVATYDTSVLDLYRTDADQLRWVEMDFVVQRASIKVAFRGRTVCRPVHHLYP